MARADTDAVGAGIERTEQPADGLEVGKTVEKVDGRGLVTGRARYTDDVPSEDALAVAVLRSPHAHAHVVSVDTEAARAMPGVRAVLTPDDVPRHRFTRSGIPRPNPIPFDERVLAEKARFVGDAICAVAADDAETAGRARDAIEVEYEVVDHVLDVSEAMDEGAPTIHDEDDYDNEHPGADLERNIAASMGHERGDVKAGFAEADHVIEAEYDVPPVQQAPMEMDTAVAWIDDRDRLVLRTSTQIPHLAKRIIAEIFDLPESRVRVIKPRVGGGFGEKQDVTPAQYTACALALATGRKVRIENTREEDLYVTQTRHAMRSRVRGGVTVDGRITALELDVVSNAGAYAAHGPTTLGKGFPMLGMYPRTNLKFTGTLVYTNLPVGGAMRGYGGPQISFAVESHVDALAAAIGMDPLELRRKNGVRTGDLAFESPRKTTEETKVIGTCGLEECIAKATAAVSWGDGPEPPDDPDLRRGFGMAITQHKSGVPNVELAGAEITLEADGTFTLRMGVGDAGQGADTAMAQIAASVLAVPTRDVNVRTDDTDVTPWDNGAFASSTTYVSGTAAEKAAFDIAGEIRQAAGRFLDGDPDGFQLESGRVVGEEGSISFADLARRLADGEGGPKAQLHGQGEHTTPLSPRPFAAQVAEVEVNVRTGELDVRTLISAVDCGFPINRENARGQVIGAAIMGLGQAVSEVLTFTDEGAPEFTGLKDYGVLRSHEVPERVEAVLVETYEPSGPFGAKSIGEIGNTAVPAAVNNAVFDAVGVHVRDLPITAEKLKAGMDRGGEES